jgi:2-hydroxychromene-2-carboxylate isomerase
MAGPGSLDLWFGFAPTWSCLSAMPIEREAATNGVVVRRRPFQLARDFAKRGRKDWPFSLRPVKGRCFWRRRAEKYGVPFRGREDASVFASRSLPFARVALAVFDAGREFCRQVFAAGFAGKDIADPAEIGACLAQARGDVSCSGARDVDAQKATLPGRGEEAVAPRIFGAPNFPVKGEIFRGDDRLEDARDRATKD